VIQATLFAELQKLCLRSFPERLDQRISQVETLADGPHPTLSLTLSWRRGHQPGVERLVVRRYSDRWTWWSSDDRAKAQREWTVLRWLYGEGLPVPKVYALGAEQEPALLLMARASGRPSAPVPGAGAAVALDEGHVDALASLLANLHQLTPPEVVREVLPTVTVIQELRRMGEMAEHSGNEGMIEAVGELGAMLAIENLEMLPSCVLHGDVRLANMLSDARGITNMLGWENSAFGDPRWDVACLVDNLHGYRAEGLADRFCAAYASQVASAPTHLLFWQALVAVHRWTVGSQAQHCTGADLLESQLGLWDETAWRTLTRLRQAKRSTE
jgi:aminoglycoside phosphotransferase (APT) family kinase protein